jgi:hypothetical protein
MLTWAKLRAAARDPRTLGLSEAQLREAEAQLREQCQRAIKEVLHALGTAERVRVFLKDLPSAQARRRIKAIAKWGDLFDAMLAAMEADPELAREVPDWVESMRDLRKKLNQARHPAEVVHATRIAASRAARKRHEGAPRTPLQEAVEWARQAAASGKYSKNRAALAAAAEFKINPDSARRLLYRRKDRP